MWWGFLFVASLIAMGSMFEAVRMQRHYNPPNVPATSFQRWAVGSSSITFLLSFLTLALQRIPQTSHVMVGTKLELITILLLLGFTCAATGTATNPATGMAVNAAGGVSFGNLYYSTWASFACVISLLLSYIRTERGLDVHGELLAQGTRFRSWFVLIVTTLIVMASSASAYDAQCQVKDEYTPNKFCRRAALGVSVGCFGCVASLIVVAMRFSCGNPQVQEGDADGERWNRIIFTLEGIVSVVLFCSYGFAVAYLTSEKGPGAPLGNLYYSSWITFGITFFVATSCFEEFQAAKSMILSRRRQPSNMQRGRGFDERERLTPDEYSVAVTDQGMMTSSGPVDWSDREPGVNGGWSNERVEQVQTDVPYGRRSGSVGEVQIDMD